MSPAPLMTACDSSRDRARQVRLRGSEYHALASLHTWASGTISPTGWSFSAAQRWTCSSDRKI